MQLPRVSPPPLHAPLESIRANEQTQPSLAVTAQLEIQSMSSVLDGTGLRVYGLPVPDGVAVVNVFRTVLSVTPSRFLTRTGM
ncbi:hypothetical protein ACOKWN_003802 [Vibrio parahaemolyticus]